MKTFLPQNQFNSASPVADDAAASSSPLRHDAAAALSDGENLSSLPSGESDPSVMLDYALSETEVAGSVRTAASDQSQAKATKGKAGMAVGTPHVRRSTAGTGLQVGVASAVLPATSEFMDATSRERPAPDTIQTSPADVPPGPKLPAASSTVAAGLLGCLTEEDEALYWQLRRADNPFARDLPRIPDAQAFLDAIDEPPLFLKAIE